MKYEFKAYGHSNVLSKHKTTLEFTKDEHLTLNGDCIVGVKADFSLSRLKDFIKKLKSKEIKIIIEVNGLKEIVKAEINPDFNSEREMVIRKSDFIDERTFAIRANKAAFELNKEIIGCLSNSEQNAQIRVIQE